MEEPTLLLNREHPAFSKRKLRNWYRTDLSITSGYSEQNCGYHRITESQNGRVWKGPLWVI